MRLHILTVTYTEKHGYSDTTISAIGTDLETVMGTFRFVRDRWKERKICSAVTDVDGHFVADLRAGANVVLKVISHNVAEQVVI